MKKYLAILFLLFSINKVFAQNLYLIFDVNEPNTTKDVYKYIRYQPNNPYINQCGVFKIGTDGYCFSYPFFYGIDLDLKAKKGVSVQTMTRTQAATLYPNAMNAAQLDAVMQPHIDYDYTHPLPTPRDKSTSATIRYFDSFAKIFVIEYLPNNQVKVVEVDITSGFE